jgi:hypothetical protein
VHSELEGAEQSLYGLRALL